MTWDEKHQKPVVFRKHSLHSLPLTDSLSILTDLFMRVPSTGRLHAVLYMRINLLTMQWLMLVLDSEVKQHKTSIRACSTSKAPDTGAFTYLYLLLKTYSRKLVLDYKVLRVWSIQIEYSTGLGLLGAHGRHTSDPRKIDIRKLHSHIGGLREMAFEIAFQIKLAGFLQESYDNVMSLLPDAKSSAESVTLKEEVDYMTSVLTQMHEDWLSLTMPRVQAQVDAVWLCSVAQSGRY